MIEVQVWESFGESGLGYVFGLLVWDSSFYSGMGLKLGIHVCGSGYEIQV